MRALLTNANDASLFIPMLIVRHLCIRALEADAGISVHLVLHYQLTSIASQKQLMVMLFKVKPVPLQWQDRFKTKCKRFSTGPLETGDGMLNFLQIAK